MVVYNYSEARQNLVAVMEKAVDDHEPVIITRKNNRSVVVMSLDDYNAIQETAYLLRSPANARHLRRSLRQAKKGKHKIHPLTEAKDG